MPLLTANDVPPLFLIPSLSGVPSSHHLVVIRRAEAKAAELEDFLRLTTAAKDNYRMHEQKTEVKKKMGLIQQAIDALVIYVARRPRSRVVTRLATVKKQLEIIHELFGEAMKPE